MSRTLLPLAGFEVTLNGRFCVTAEAKLGRRVIDHYLYFQGRLKGEPENLDELVRFADDCRELIESNLPLFMRLSAGGRNIHSAIDEEVQR